MAPNLQARPIFGQKFLSWGKNGRIWAKHPNFFWQGAKLWYPNIRNPLGTSFAFVFRWGMAPNGPKRPIFGENSKKCQFWAHPQWRDRRPSTLNFGPGSTKLASHFNFPKILILIEDVLVPARIGETAIFPRQKKAKRFTKKAKN